MRKLAIIASIALILGCDGEKVNAPQDIKMEVSQVENFIGTTDILYVALFDQNDNPISDQQVTIKRINGDATFETGTVATTGQNGEAQFAVTLREEFSTTIEVSYAGSENYKSQKTIGELISKYKYKVPEGSDDMAIGDLFERDLNLFRIQDVIDLIRKNADGYEFINSIAIQQGGELLLEEYFLFEEREDQSGIELERFNGTHYIASVSKSVTSAALGIALDKFIINTEDKVLDYYPNLNVAEPSEEKDRMTIQNLLDMQSGLGCTDGDFFASDNFVIYTLNLPIVTNPGTSFNYCSGMTILLCDLIKKVSGLDAREFTYEYIFNDLKIADDATEWSYDQVGNVGCGYGYWMKTVDMIKFGQLYLNRGEWNGKQLIPEEWIDLTFSRKIATGDSNLYGNHWWHADYSIKGKSFEAHHAIGNGGNYITVIPDLDMVITLQGADWNSGTLSQVFENEILGAFILPEFVE